MHTAAAPSILGARMLRAQDSMAIERPGGDRIALVKKALISPVRDRLTVQVQGNIPGHEYNIGEGRDKAAEVSKKWFRVRDTNGAEIEPGQSDALILAATVGIDQLTQQG
jgi:uncharacterized protein YxjI